MLVKFMQGYRSTDTAVNPARVDYIEDAGDGETFIYFSGIDAENTNRIRVFGGLDEVAAKLNGEVAAPAVFTRAL